MSDRQSRTALRKAADLAHGGPWYNETLLPSLYLTISTISSAVMMLGALIRQPSEIGGWVALGT